MLVVVKGLNLTTDTPAVLLVQRRQAGRDQDKGWPDEYAVQVITTSETEIQVLVRRLDPQLWIGAEPAAGLLHR